MIEREKPLGLDMDFGEALERFLGTDPAELPDNVKLRKGKGLQKRPPQGAVNGKAEPEPEPD